MALFLPDSYRFLALASVWIGNPTLLEPYSPIFIVIVLLLFGWAGWQFFGQSRLASRIAPVLHHKRAPRS